MKHEFLAYRYVGPHEIRQAALSQPEGKRIRSLKDLSEWLDANPDALREGATFVVGLSGDLQLAPRRSEHVACAKGAEVLAAGEIRFGRAVAPRVAAVSNQSTGYCPDVTSWSATAHALARAGLAAPNGFSHQIIFRRCPRCNEINLVKESWFVCVFCDSDLPNDWNIAERRTVTVSD